MVVVVAFTFSRFFFPFPRADLNLILKSIPSAFLYNLSGTARGAGGSPPQRHHPYRKRTFRSPRAEQDPRPNWLGRAGRSTFDLSHQMQKLRCIFNRQRLAGSELPLSQRGLDS